MRATQLGNTYAYGSTRRVEVPTGRIDLSAEWSSRALGDIAKAAGMHTFTACDERTFSLLLGLYREREIILYGYSDVPIEDENTQSKN